MKVQLLSGKMSSPARQDDEEGAGSQSSPSSSTNNSGSTATRSIKAWLAEAKADTKEKAKATEQKKESSLNLFFGLKTKTYTGKGVRQCTHTDTSKLPDKSAFDDAEEESEADDRVKVMNEGGMLFTPVCV